MIQKKLIRSIEAVVLTAGLTFTTVSATTPVYADITEELTQEAEASAEQQSSRTSTLKPQSLRKRPSARTLSRTYQSIRK
ncbi:MAG: hypothetical protein K6G81_11795 [Lachnospiraceae bacterium]|nr:hypothetical protein [Lachnospiraceae bacterium]